MASLVDIRVNIRDYCERLAQECERRCSENTMYSVGTSEADEQHYSTVAACEAGKASAYRNVAAHLLQFFPEDGGDLE